MVKQKDTPLSVGAPNGASEPGQSSTDTISIAEPSQPGDDASTIKDLTKLVQATVGIDENQATTLIYAPFPVTGD